MPLGRTLLVALLSLVVALGTGAPATAAEPTTLGLAATGGYAGAQVALTGTLTTSSGDPVVGVTVTFQRRAGATWTPIATAVTDDAGVASAAATRSRDADTNVFRVTYAGDTTYDPAVSPARRSALQRRPSVVTVGGARNVVDERSAVLRIEWRTRSGEPVAGKVLLQQRDGRRWRTVRTVTTGSQGRADIRVSPRVDTRWRAVAPRLDWVASDRSPVHRLDNRPSGTPVRLPRAAPKPRVKVPPQPRATGQGARPVVSRIPNGVWNNMTGRSWHRGCPVGRSGLRLLRINYWGYDGYRYRGELVAAAGAVDNMARALSAMYAGRYPIRSMYRVDRFGWSGRLQGANDYRSMAAGNTSAFNCRSVVNRPGVRSPHSYGRALDVNTWENPYRSATGLVPNSWWQPHSHARVAWRSRSHPVVRIMLRNGFRWTYGTGDSQHFDVGGGASGRYALPAECRVVVCH